MLKVKISVRNLIESIMRSGDIDDSYKSSKRMLQGTLAHQKVQASYGENYKAEVSIKTSLEYENFILDLEGRADGIFTHKDKFTIEEIKSTTKELDEIEENFNPLHWAQVKFYGFMYMENNNLDKIELKLTYYHLETEETKEFFKEYTKTELENYCFEIIKLYVEWANVTFYWIETRNKSLDSLNFPFTSYRKNQRDLSVAVYKTIKEENKLFLQAPTGIGKTMSTLFPALKNMGEKQGEKIFYLTAKTITRESPIKAYKVLLKQNIKLKTIVITSKEKICMNEKVECNPKACEYAKGHFDRVNDAIRDIFENEDLFSREIIERYADKHTVCPFEYSLDLADFSDLIICDYNYLFDPQVMLKRFFELNKTDYVFLIDEVHNLVDRARSMYSGQVTDSQVIEVLEIVKDDKKLYKSLMKLLTEIDIAFEKNDVEEEIFIEDIVDELFAPLERTMINLDNFLVQNKDIEGYEIVLELYFDLLSYLRVADYYDEHFLTSLEDKSHKTIKINCIDPSYVIKQRLDKGRASIMFSATLSPMDYYIDVLGGNGKNYNMILPSPFDRNNLSVSVVDNVSTKYKDREFTYFKVVKYIEEFVASKDGNYLIFFPSFSYMENIYDLFKDRTMYGNIIIQDRVMGEGDREDFLNKFNSDGVVGFAVMGGIFSEGIDLVGDKLIGAVIVGVGLPMICFENNMIKSYFQEYFQNGFDYAYTYPGINKVFQAAGRVIRREEDRGAILLIDSRYRETRYKELIPNNWWGYNVIRSTDELKKVLEIFWN